MCCHPSHADALAAALVEKKFVVLAAGPGALAGAAMPRTVLLRRQPAIKSRALAQGAIATPEKAWVDLLRDTRRSSAPFDYGELGRLLRAMSDHALNWRALRSYVARLGYQDWLAATTGERPPEGPAQSRLAAGYASASPRPAGPVEMPSVEQLREALAGGVGAAALKRIEKIAAAEPLELSDAQLDAQLREAAQSK